MASQDNDITFTAKPTATTTITVKPATPVADITAKPATPVADITAVPYTYLLLAEDLTELAAEDGVSLSCEGYGRP